MNNEEYMRFVLSKTSAEGKVEPLLNAILGLVGEIGELADAVKKWRYQRHYLTEEQIMDELGDVVFYVFLAMHACETNLDMIMHMNVNKLNERYPNGFDSERSMNRS